MTLEQLETDIINHYPRSCLAMSGFTLARADKGRRLDLFAGNTVEQLESFLGKGKLIVIPKRDLAIPEPAQQEEVSNRMANIVVWGIQAQCVIGILDISLFNSYHFLPLATVVREPTLME